MTHSSAGAPPGTDLLAHVVSRLRGAGCVFAEEEAALVLEAAATPAEVEDLVSRRAAGLPLEHLLGWARFCGHRITVEPGVFVPRHRTEFLVRTATRLARDRASRAGLAGRNGRMGEAAAGEGRPITVVDLCCGSGALGLVLAHTLGGPVELHASDIDPVAVRCARHNLRAVGGTVHQGDLFAPLPTRLRGRVDVLIANVPYVPTRMIELMPPEARLHEPRVALDGGTDGLEVFRRVLAAAPTWLAPGGHLLVESDGEQAATAAREMEAAGLAAQVLEDHGDDSDQAIGGNDENAFEDDEGGGATVVLGTLPAS